MTHELWSALNAHIFQFLRGVTLAQLVAQQQSGEVAVLQDQRSPAAANDRRAEPAPAL
jgi:Rrf2 family iron-sulfur cluster assembly transcriptional regulator